MTDMRSSLTRVERFDRCLDIIEGAERMLLCIEVHETPFQIT
jgi:hypothetical protein